MIILLSFKLFISKLNKSCISSYSWKSNRDWCPVEFWRHRNHFGTITWHASSVNITSTPATSVFGAKLICSNLFSHTKQPLSANKVFYQSAFAAATYVCNAASRVRARLWHQPVGNTSARSSKLSLFENQRNKDN